VPKHLFRYTGRVKFSAAERHLDRGSELQEAAGSEADLAVTDSWRRQQRRAIGPLDGKPDRPAARVLRVDVSPLAVDAADVANHRESHAYERVDGQRDGHAVGRRRCT
jgi:hypothetical protein